MISISLFSFIEQRQNAGQHFIISEFCFKLKGVLLYGCDFSTCPELKILISLQILLIRELYLDLLSCKSLTTLSMRFYVLRKVDTYGFMSFIGEF
jgi:hypothetical protein